MTLLYALHAYLRARFPLNRSEAGQSTFEGLSWGAVFIIVIIGIGAAVAILGDNVVTYISTHILP